MLHRKLVALRDGLRKFPVISETVLFLLTLVDYMKPFRAWGRDRP